MTNINDSIKKWWFSKKIEDFPKEELKKRIKTVMNLELEYKIDTIPYVGEEDEITWYETKELVALCPMTGYPDFYHIIIGYVPDKHLPELKSLKFYLMQYMNIPISHEHLIAKIYNDFIEAVRPKDGGIFMRVNTRGGIDTQIVIGNTKLIYTILQLKGAYEFSTLTNELSKSFSCLLSDEKE